MTCTLYIGRSEETCIFRGRVALEFRFLRIVFHMRIRISIESPILASPVGDVEAEPAEMDNGLSGAVGAGDEEDLLRNRF